MPSQSELLDTAMSGDVCHTSLSIPAEPDADLAHQAASVFGQILAAFEARGIGPDGVVRTRVYVNDMRDFAAVAAAHSQAFGASAPANSMMQLGRFPRPGVRIMAEATAVKGLVLRPVKAGVPMEQRFGFSRAMRAGNHGYSTGATGWNSEGRIDDADDFYGQTRIALQKLVEAASAMGGDASNVVHTRIYVRSLDGFEAVARAHREVFGALRPASTLVEVAGFFEPAMAIEIEGEMDFGERRRVDGGSDWEPWFGFSRGYAAGRTLQISGTSGAGETATEQAEAIADTIAETLGRAGHAPADVVGLRVFLCNPEDADAIRAVLDRRFPRGGKVWSFLAVPRLVDDAMRLEVSAESHRTY